MGQPVRIPLNLLMVCLQPSPKYSFQGKGSRIKTVKPLYKYQLKDIDLD